MCIRDSRKAVWAVAIEGLNVAEAARQLQMPRSTLVSQLKAVSYTHLRAHETVLDLVCRLLLEKKKEKVTKT